MTPMTTSHIKKKEKGSAVVATMPPSIPPTSRQGLGSRTHLDKIDKLRALGVSSTISLPQLVVVGDQSAGKSSVLESLTGFHFPRAVNLCTRHATEIICRREDQRSIVVSIHPDSDASQEHIEYAQSFRMEMAQLDGPELKEIFEEAAKVMGIEGDHDGPVMGAFSTDVLRVEISGPEEENLTIIDVPGIFEHATPGITTDSDIELVKNMVKKYIQMSRTIILAVVPCNVDIATQTILKFASEADPSGVRTLGVLTKPDLAIETATKAAVVDLLRGNRNDLALGYCCVRNRGADDISSTSVDRDRAERAFFAAQPWTTCPDRVGIPKLKARLHTLLSDRTRSELPIMAREITKELRKREHILDEMGPARCSDQEQRTYLAGVAGRFEKLKAFALDAYYTGDAIFDKNPELKLITRMRQINEKFSQIFYERGHTREFEGKGKKEEDRHEPSLTAASREGEQSRSDLYPIDFEIPTKDELDLEGILSESYFCLHPKDDDIFEHIQQVYMTSRGYELGTFGASMIPTTFREQTGKWEPLVLAHVSNAILIVHHFIRALVDDACGEATVRTELWSHLQSSLVECYGRAMDHARFLLKVERGSARVFTVNPEFKKRLGEIREQRARTVTKGMNSVSLNCLLEVLGLGNNKDKGGQEDTDNDSPPHNEPNHEDTSGNGNVALESLHVDSVRHRIHDVLQAYYIVSRSRFVDDVCVAAIGHFLLGEGGPLHVLSQEMVLGMNSSELDSVAGENAVSRNQRERLQRDVDALRSGLEVLKAR